MILLVNVIYLPWLFFFLMTFHFWKNIPASNELLGKELDSVSKSMARPTRAMCGRGQGLSNP